MAVVVARSASLRITEIFHSLQGESRSIGLPTVFVRLTGCPLRCQYCDSAYAFHGGQQMEISDIVAQVRGYDCPYVTVTGGEPLAQPGCHTLLAALCDAGLKVSLETSGALPVAEVDHRVSRVVDLKTPGSGEEHRNLWENLDVLNRRDQVKFVICDRRDYDWAREQLRARAILERVDEVLFSPSWEQLDAARLADWILEDRLPVRFQVQLHKVLWGDTPGR
jgi:7-carboxy-7-deazaguanine synthase